MWNKDNRNDAILRLANNLVIPIGWRLNQRGGQRAEVCYQKRFSVILELSGYPGSEETQIVRAFLEALLNILRSQDEDMPHLPFALNIDEAHLYVPQVGGSETAVLVNDLGKLGRQLNLTMFASTQTPTDIQKKFLKQRNVLIAHQVNGSDISILAEASGQTPKTIIPIVNSLVAGQAIVTGDADFLDLGGQPYLLTKIDLYESGVDQPAATSSNTPLFSTLDATALEELRAALRHPERPNPADKDALIQRLYDQIRQLKQEIDRLKNTEKVITTASLPEPANPDQLITIQVTPVNVGRTKLAAPRRPVSVQVDAGNGDGPVLLIAGAKRILRKLADLYPMRVTRSQIATLTDYTVSGGTFNANWAALERYDFVIEDDQEECAITPSGFTYLGLKPREIPPDRDGLIAMWREVLHPREYAILTVLIGMYPQATSKEALGDTVGMTFTGGAFNGYLSNLRRNHLILTDKVTVSANGEALRL